jgi:hypothetical protein
MRKYRLYHPAQKETVTVHVLHEYGHEFGSENITAEEILISEYADYTPCTVSIPAELHPEVCESLSGIRLLYVDGLPPEFRYRIRYHGGRPYMEALAPSDDEYTHPPTLYRFRVHFEK